MYQSVAIKDGHRGHLPHPSHAHHLTAGTLDAERADRISRLAGLERVATARNPTPLGNLTPGASAPPTSGYFDATGNPAIARERSTVGSASATGSVGGRTTWASGSDVYEDKMSESQGDMEMDASSVSGISDTNSLVGFGEGARTPARYSGYGSGSPSIGKATPTAPSSVPFAAAQREASLTPIGIEQRGARYQDGMTYDSQAGDNAHRTPEPRFPMGGTATAGTGAEAAERIIQERLGGDGSVDKIMVSPDGSSTQGGRDLGKFYFENR